MSHMSMHFHKFAFLQIKPYSKDIYNRIWWRSMCTQAIRQKTQWTLVLKDVKLTKCLVVSSCTDGKQLNIHNRTVSLSAASRNKQTDVSESYIRVQLRVLVLVREKTPLNIQWVSGLLKQAFIVFFDELCQCTCSSVVFSWMWHQQQALTLRTALFIIIMQ